MYPDRKKFVLEPFMLVPIFSGKSYTKKVINIDPANLAGYWPMNEASGATADNAEGTAARDGTYTGVTLGQPGIGDGNTCPYFDGANDIMNLNSASLGAACISDEMTIMCWAKVANAGVWTDGLWAYIMVLTYGSSTDLMWIIKSNVNNKLQFNTEWGNGGPTVPQFTPISTTDWMHLAITMSVSADEVWAYVNGVKTSGVPGSGMLTQLDIVLDPVRALVGARHSTVVDCFNGYIAHAAIWTSALTPAQIAELAAV